MKKICFVFLGLWIFAAVSYAAQIELKSGKVVNAEIIERESDYIKIDMGIGLPITYYLDEIIAIDGEGVLMPKKQPFLTDKPIENSFLAKEKIEVGITQEISKSEMKERASESHNTKEPDWLKKFNEEVKVQEAVQGELTIDESKWGAYSPKKSPYEYRRYGIESGIIVYKYSGSIKGEETLYFDHWGMREARYKKTKGKKMPDGRGGAETNTISILDGEWVTTIDLIRNTGMRVQNFIFMKAADEMGTNDIGALSKKVLQDMGGAKTGEKKILGRKCNVWEQEGMGGSSHYIWEGIALKLTMDLFGSSIEMVAKSIKENVKIPEDKFKAPTGVAIRSIGF